MGFRAASAEEVYRYAFRLDEPNRTLTDRFGLSLIMINDGSPVCTEFLQRYFVDLCHRTADRIRFIFFSDFDKRVLEDKIRYDTSPLQVILRMLPYGRRRHFDGEDEYGKRGLWNKLRPRGLHPIHSPEQTFRELNFNAQLYSAVPGIREAHRFAQRLGIGRYVPCIVAFNDIGSLSVDVMPIRGMTADEIYCHVREWVDSFYEQNQVDIHYWSQVERSIEELQEKSKIPLKKINEWQYRCQNSWKELKILANAISEVSSLKDKDRVSFFNLVDKYKEDYNFSNEVIRDFEKNYNDWQNSNPIILDTLLELEENLVHTVGFEELHSLLGQILKKQNFYERYCRKVVITATALHKRYLLLEKENPHISEYRKWWKKRANSRLSWKKFRKARNKWIQVSKECDQNAKVKDEFEYIFQFIRQFSLSLKSDQGAKIAIAELAKYYTINPKSEQWLMATQEFCNTINEYLRIIQKTCPTWLVQNNPSISIRDAIPLDNEPGGNGNIYRLPKDHPLFITIIENHKLIQIIQKNKKNTDEWRSQCLQALRESIKRYTLSDDEFHQMRSNFINLLQKYRTQLESKVNKIQKELLSVGLWKKQITLKEIQTLKNELDKYQAIVNQFIYPHKIDPNIINIPIFEPLIEACGFNDRDLSNQRRKLKDINTIKQEIDILPTEEQKNVEKWKQFTETAKRYSPENALSFALKQTIPRNIIEEAFNNTENINFETNIATQIKQGDIVFPLLKLNKTDLANVIKVLSQDTKNTYMDFAEKTRPVEQILILIGADITPALNYIKQLNKNKMANSQTKIFSDLEQDDIIQLDSSLNEIFRNIDSVKGKKSLLHYGGVDNYFIDALDFNLGTSEFITNSVAKFKEYKVSSRKPDYHPLISFLEYLMKEQKKYNLDDQDLEIFNKVVIFGKQKIKALSTNNATSQTNLIISQIGNSEPVIGIITALEKEYVAVKAVFEQGRDVKKKGVGAGRRYWLTDIKDSEGNLQKVAVTLADMGNNIAAIRATNMLNHYPTVQSIIMCGIAGGVPHPTKGEDHVRLGDIVVSNKKGIVQYDFDKEYQNFTEIRAMPVPASAELIEAAKYLRSNEMLGQRPWEYIIVQALQRLNWQRPPQETDLLYSPVPKDEIICHPEDSERHEDQPRIFLGAIGSANKLLKNPQKRDLLRDQFGVKAIEMEASGVADATWNHRTGYLVVRGICDYCDTHKSDTWQKYSAVTAAAYVKSLLASL